MVQKVVSMHKCLSNAAFMFKSYTTLCAYGPHCHTSHSLPLCVYTCHTLQTLPIVRFPNAPYTYLPAGCKLMCLHAPHAQLQGDYSPMRSLLPMLLNPASEAERCKGVLAEVCVFSTLSLSN